MLKRRVLSLAVTGITIVAATLLTLSTTTASAATTAASAPGHVTAPQAAEAAGCVTDTFGIWDENTYEQCVRDEQVLLNDLWSIGAVSVNQRLTVDGFYGSHTYSDVKAFQSYNGLVSDGKTGPLTWNVLCHVTYFNGFQGAYWHDAGCATLSY